MLIRDLVLSDAENLLEFELSNREWFERFVSPRGERFYTVAAVRDHIRAYLISKQQGRFHGCLVLDENGVIVARANLREIDRADASAEVGYRVGQSQVGKGIATLATRHLIRLAYEEWQIRQLRGFVSVTNPASARVLEKSGFVRVAHHTLMAQLRSGRSDCYEYLHNPATDS
jgi:ribosomal-protein-alanine N-acetyltransferase